MKRKFTAIVLGALVLFVWNAISWMVLPFHGSSIQTLPEEVVESIESMSSALESGVYHYPGLNDPEMMSKTASGPRVPLMSFQSGPTDPMDTGLFLTGLLYNFITSFLLLQILLFARVQSWKSAANISLTVGLVIVFLRDLPEMNWYLFPLKFTIINAIDHVIMVVLAGLVIAKTGKVYSE